MEELLSCGFDVLQSLDPQAGIDLADMKKRFGHRICLAGNVNCGMIHSGTREEVANDSRRALKEGMPGGGFIFMSSNTIFEGVPLENYMAMWEVWREEGKYS
jgi:uroporphyrinogen decarboxylase